MSINLYSEKEINEMLGAVLNRQDCKKAIRHTRVYLNSFHLRHTLGQDIDLEEITEEILIHSFNCFAIANRLAFAVPYGYNVDPKVEIAPLHKLLLPKVELLSKLKSLYYNLFTNGGTIFLGQDQEEVLKALLDALQ